MCTKLLSLFDDLYNPDSPHILINSIRSFINSRLDHEKKSPEFITEVRRRLYFLHEYNCQVAKVTSKYPRTRKFDLLLVKYIELEFDVLYDNPLLSKQIEITTESRILRLLQVMLYPAVHNSEPLVNLHTDGILKKAVLQLLGEVRSRYLVENKLVCNIANKILRRTDNRTNCKKTSIWEIHKNLATSDYGTDDSDSDTENLSDKHLGDNGGLVRTEKGCTAVSDCIEVPLTTNDATPIPTIEFVDDDNYFVYLQKGRPKKRKFEDRGRKISAKRSSSNLKSEKTNHDPPCVSLCSDSEDEISEVTPNNHKTIPNNVNRKNINKNRGVVTFEILDDDDNDDDTGNKANYMVYLQKEVKTNTKKIKRKEINCQEIVICSDSEEEIFTESKKSVKEEEFVVQEKEMSSAVGEIESEIKIEEAKVSKNDYEDIIKFEDNQQTSDEITTQNSGTNCDDNIAIDNDKSSISTSVRMEEIPKSPDTNPSNKRVNAEYINPIASTSSHGYNNIVMFENEVGGPLNDNIGTNFLIDPTVTFVSPARCEDLAFMKESISKTTGQAIPGYNTLGGPFLNDKVNSPEDLDNTQDCRINESFLDELLLDDNYLLEGQKEFEELESFLFNDTAEKQGFYLSTFSFDDNENIMQPETFDADVKSLESLLQDSQLFNIPDPKYQKPCNNDGGNETRKNQWTVSVIKNPVSFEHINNTTVNENKRNSSVSRQPVKFCRR